MRYSKLRRKSKSKKASRGDSRRMLLFAYMNAARLDLRAGDEGEGIDDVDAGVSLSPLDDGRSDLASAIADGKLIMEP